MPRRGLVPRRWSGAATVAGNRWAGGAVAGRQRPPSGLRGAVCGLGWGVGVVHKVIHRPCSRPGDKSTRRPLQLGQSRHIALPTPGALHSTAARPRQHNSREQSFRARKCHTKERRQRVSPVNPWLRFPEEEPNLPTSTVPTHSLWIRFRNSPALWTTLGTTSVTHYRPPPANSGRPQGKRVAASGANTPVLAMAQDFLDDFFRHFPAVRTASRDSFTPRSTPPTDFPSAPYAPLAPRAIPPYRIARHGIPKSSKYPQTGQSATRGNMASSVGAAPR